MVWSDFHLHPVSSLEEALIKNSQKISKRMDFRIMTKKNTKQKNSVQQLAAEHLGESVRSHREGFLWWVCSSLHPNPFPTSFA